MTPPPCEANDLLLVTNASEDSELETLLRQSGMSVTTATSCQQARQRLSAGRDPEVVVTALSLKDGSWWTVRRAMIEQHSMASLIVCLPTIDGGVTDVLEAGCTAVLVPPYKLDRVSALMEATRARRLPLQFPRTLRPSASRELPIRGARGHVA